MFYISNNKADLEAYNQRVVDGEQYDGTTTTTWANIIEHQNGNQYAILANSKYESTLQTVDTLDGWFEEELV